ncbi:NAD(P)/FAD-dependent oxidoreductase [Streptomyces albipurpureus]|uniref:Tryptophan 7-halogenase n=1 Tax=Streptomyces albipurpureus TaxID=2897419 RepID=A0ABT0UMN8_9ACTN|nr:FAD-dependent monooxygenase [Streptomyces sp. CWNU-1]MCM2389887.1 tryptophan 7-halogenase [Streptomyces sp. CWNU-1]
MTQPARHRISDLSAEKRALLTQRLRRRAAEGTTEPDRYDVVVLGGGAAGLTLALHLRRVRPGIRVLVAERQEHPVPEAAHKVGESTVEIAAHYLRDVLGLGAHLETEQIRKFGLRMFFSGHANDDIAKRVELGSSVFPPLATYQLDRGRLENALGAACAREGIDFRAGSKVLQVEFSTDRSEHDVQLLVDSEKRSVQARWVVDATGRGHFLQRRFALRKDVGHKANAAWFRVGHPIDLGTWSDDPDWHSRIREGRRELSTNHLMGPGYWVWLIRLASGAISIGIVADDATHSFEGFNTLERALDWLAEHEPQCAEAVEEHRDKIQDFRVMKDYSYSCDQVYDGAARWCLTGESGIFLDPLYSPGLDLIAVSNGLVADLVTRSLDGEDVTVRASVHDSLFRRVTDMWLAIYENQYALMGNARVMVSKVIWDTSFYWGVFGLLFFQGKFTTVAESPSVASDLERLADISNRVQAFFREWAAIDDSPLEARFVDLYSPLNFMVQLHAGMADDLSDDQFPERFSANTRLFAQLAGQLVTAVIDAHGDRYGDDRVIAQVQSWQRDPLIADLIAIHRQERHRNRTSEGWIVLREPGAGEGTAGHERDGADSMEQHSSEVSYV